MQSDRYIRHLEFFGLAGQERLARVRVGIIGLGGTGSHVAQQLAYLGCKNFCLIDADRVEESNLNRLVNAVPRDADDQRLKIEIAARSILTLTREADIEQISDSFVSQPGFAAIKKCDVVFGCVDKDSARLILNELCQAYEIPYFDIATEISRESSHQFGGRYVYSHDGVRCVFCSDVLDQEAIRAELATATQRHDDAAIYGVPRDLLLRTGPSVVSLNAVLASIAVTEFMLEWTGIRKAQDFLIYRGDLGLVTRSGDPPRANCPYCKGSIRGARESAEVERWLVQLGTQAQSIRST